MKKFTAKTMDRTAHLVFPGLWLGGWGPAASPRFLRENKVALVVRMLPGSLGPDPAAAPGTPPHEGLPLTTTVSFPAVDSPLFDIAPAAWGAALAAANALAGGHVVYVHCHAGVSRSATVAALLLMHLRPGTSAAEALQTLQRRRPGVAPNAGFRQFLTEASYQIRATPLSVNIARLLAAR